MTDVQDRLASLASRWAEVAAGFVTTVPVRPASAASFEPHVLTTICVEIVLPLAATAPQWDEQKVDKRLGRIAMKLQHLESIGEKVGRDLGVADLVADTRDLLTELKVRSTIGKHMGKAPPAYYESSIGADEAVVAERALRALSSALAQGDGGSLRSAGTLEYRFRDGPGVLGVLDDEGRDRLARHQAEAVDPHRARPPERGRRRLAHRAARAPPPGARRRGSHRAPRRPGRAVRDLAARPRPRPLGHRGHDRRGRGRRPARGRRRRRRGSGDEDDRR